MMKSNKEVRLLHIRLPAEMVEELNALLRKTGMSKNEFVKEAVAAQLTQARVAEKIEAAHGVLRPEDAPDWAGDSADWVRRIRTEDEGRTWAT
ncbi:MAG: ribbon-helix-helix domain-containing protein [Thermoanaerobacteraceae bacterium]|jgi:predicted DNA-binding protein|nr:ribbon-helix-helix domain-containing protein [Thermoanaerobacteraceae bacterium]